MGRMLSKSLIFFILFFNCSTFLYAHDLKFDLDFNARKDFFDQVIVPSLHNSDHLFVPNYTGAIIPIGMSMVPQIAAVPFLLSILGPVGIMQIGVGEIIRGINATHKIHTRNDSVRTLSFEKLLNLKPLLSDEEIFWFWRNLKAEDIISKKNRVHKKISSGEFKEAFNRYFQRIKGRSIHRDERAPLIKMMNKLSFVHLTHPTAEILHALKKISILDDYGHLKDKERSSFEIIKALSKESLDREEIRTILHDLGYIDPSDILSLRGKFPYIPASFFNLLMEKRFANITEVEDVLDTIWLGFKREKRKISLLTSEKLLKEKLKYAEEKQNHQNDYHLLRLEKELMRFKKSVIYLLHLKRINNDCLTYQGVKAGATITTGMTYVAGMGFITNSLLHTILSFAPMADAAVTTLSIGAAGALGVTGAAVSTIGAVNLSRDLPSYLNISSDVSTYKKVLKHLQKAGENSVLSENELKILALKEFEVASALELKRQKRLMLLNRIGIDGTTIAIGATATAAGVIGILAASGATYASVYAAPAGLALDGILVLGTIPLAALTVDYLYRQHKEKKTAMLISYLQKGVRESFMSRDMSYSENVLKFNKVFSQDKDLVLKLGFATLDLSRERNKVAQKKYGSWYTRILKRRYQLLSHDVLKHKKEMQHQVEKAIKKEELWNPSSALKLANTDPIFIHRDVYDQFDLLKIMEDGHLDVSSSIPRWNLVEKNQKNLAKAFAHFIYSFILLKENIFEISLYKQDQKFIQRHKLSIDDDQKKKYDQAVIDLVHHNEKIIRSHLKEWHKIFSEDIQGVDRQSVKKIQEEVNQIGYLSRLIPEKFTLDLFPAVRDYLLLYVPYSQL